MTRLTRENDLCFPLFFKSHGFHSNYLVIMKFLGVFFSGFKGVPLWKKSTFSHNLNKNVSLYSRKRFLKKSKTNSPFPNKTGFPLWTLSNHVEKENGSFHLQNQWKIFLLWKCLSQSLFISSDIFLFTLCFPPTFWNSMKLSIFNFDF